MEVKGREVNKELPLDCLNWIFNLNPAYSFFFCISLIFTL